MAGRFMEGLIFIVLSMGIFTAVDALESKGRSRKETGSGGSVLSRRKRYVVFPEGSTLSVAICMTAQTILPEQIFTEGLNWGISYELPNDTSSVKQFFRPKQFLQRRHRRDLYQKMEVIMNSMGFDGRSCILKALCETTRKLMPRGNSIVEELLRIVFRFPQQQLLNSEPEDHRVYHWAYRMGKDSAKECSDMFPGCTFSLIDMALGEYSQYLTGTETNGFT